MAGLSWTEGAFQVHNGYFLGEQLSEVKTSSNESAELDGDTILNCPEFDNNLVEQIISEEQFRILLLFFCGQL
jgi:hypothetical protein